MKQKGFTLIELLVSIILVSYMLTLASVALRNMLLSWEKLAVSYPVEVLGFHRLQSVIQSLIPYTTQHADIYGNRRDTIAFFMDRKKTSCSFITGSPLKGPGPALITIYREGAELMIAETPLYANNTDYNNPEENKSTFRMSLVNHVAEIQFSYQDREWVRPDFEYPYPASIRLHIQFEDDTNSEYIFSVRSDFPEKLQLMQKMGQDA
ncbi:type II secretion system protein [Desulfocapsa sp. AH-315-G09]|uniref:Type II secretion system protein n=1 Tax=Desulfotalea psychrophila TaxID=84980 RepID=A0ABS3AUE5_9BACT|nr:type II secretion system protein [Desulfocapsa sp.]MBN4065427.1 type II secretion system protein [Desulfocapsa sp. AH-315-G09]MBN4068705.1 type II secretion system protein [Desulfotalea psychrophila]